MAVRSSIRTVSLEWFAGALEGREEIQILDPRTSGRYLSGHARGALGVPLRGAFDEQGRLREHGELLAWLGGRGVRVDLPLVVYGDGDGQAATMLAWLLEYLGHPDTRLLNAPFEVWASAEIELFYRPVAADTTSLELHLKPGVLAQAADLDGSNAIALLDVRTPAEFSGEVLAGEERSGHVPGAINIPWTAFSGSDEVLLADGIEIHGLLNARGIHPADETIVYCRSGPRASLAYQALSAARIPTRLYAGSWLDWVSDPSRPVSTL